MNPAPVAGDLSLQRLEVLHGFKRLLGRDPARNVTPFTENQVVCYRTDVDDVDVPEIHVAARRLIEGAIQEVGSRQQAQIILLAGAPGMGKSHLLNHFRRADVAKQLGYCLVSPTNHWDIDEFEERLLDSLLTALVHPSPNEAHPLLDRIETIAFTVLRQLLDQPGGIRSFRPTEVGFVRRLLARFGGSNQDKVTKLVAACDVNAFRLLDFNKFSSYVCDRFLAEPGNPLHRYVLRVLLCYLFEEDREYVLHWLRGRPTQGHFTRRFGVEEELDRTYKRMDAVRLLTNLFARDVTAGLTAAGNGGDDRLSAALASRVFFVAFDQAEGRNELFDSEDDWLEFFAHLAELYNTLPNVLILFTMTTGLRDKLHSKVEKQFRDRIRRDARFVLHYVEDGEMLALYRKRLDRWIGPGEADLREALAAAGEPHLPFTAAQVVQTSQQKTLRESLETLDGQFREELARLTTDVPYDYLIWKRELRPKLSGDEYQDTSGHLETVATVLANLGEALAGAYEIVLEQVTRQNQDGIEVLLLRFHHLEDSGRWVRVYLCRLTPHYKEKLKKALDLLAYLNKKKNFLRVVRAAPISLDSLAERPGQAFFHQLSAETEITLQAMVRVIAQRQDYELRDEKDKTTHWADGVRFLTDEFSKTHLGDLFTHARQAIENLAAIDTESDPDPSLTTAKDSPDSAEQRS